MHSLPTRIDIIRDTLPPSRRTLDRHSRAQQLRLSDFRSPLRPVKLWLQIPKVSSRAFGQVVEGEVGDRLDADRESGGGGVGVGRVFGDEPYESVMNDDVRYG